MKIRRIDLLMDRWDEAMRKNTPCIFLSLLCFPLKSHGNAAFWWSYAWRFGESVLQGVYYCHLLHHCRSTRERLEEQKNERGRRASYLATTIASTSAFLHRMPISATRRKKKKGERERVRWKWWGRWCCCSTRLSHRPPVIVLQKCIFLVTFSCLFFIKRCYLNILLFSNVQASIIKKRKEPKRSSQVKEKPKSPSSPSYIRNYYIQS